MHLVPQWQRVLRRAWSIRLNLLAGVFAIAEVVLPLYQDEIPRGVFAGLTGIAILGGIIARVVAQKGITHAQPDDE